MGSIDDIIYMAERESVCEATSSDLSHDGRCLRASGEIADE